MKKRIIVAVVLVVAIVICGGCDLKYASTTREIRHSGFALSGAEFTCDDLVGEERTDEVKFLTSKHAIMESGSVYELSIGQKFSNDQNCKASPFSSKVVAIFDENVVKMDNGQYFYLVRTGENAAYTAVLKSDDNYAIYDILLKDSQVLKVKTLDSSSGYYYVLKKDGNVYNYVVLKNNDSVSIVSSPVIYSKSNYNGNIIDFNYAGKTSSTFVRTTSQIFRMKATNKQECSKYVDVVCEYEMSLDEGLTEHQDRILGFSGSFLITVYGKQFNVTA